MMEKEKIMYIKVFIDRKAADHLYSWLKYQEKINKNSSIDNVFTYLQNDLDNLDHRLKTQQLLRKLKMQFLADFNNFQAEFM